MKMRLPIFSISINNKRVKQILKNILLINTYRRIKYSKIRSICSSNSRFKNIHDGERCFIMCNGPSINKQNLLLLKNDIVFSVSNGYHHKDYLAIQPKYHCIPGLEYTELIKEDTIIQWFNEMHPKIGNATLFMDVKEKSLVKENNLFPGREINYIYSGLPLEDCQNEIIDISKMIQGISSVPILCMTIAMYMGFKKIYLIGIDNDWWKTGEYKYFYEPTILKGKEITVYPDGKNREPLYRQFLGFSALLRDYWIFHNIASANNISIFNATEGGALEEFERVKFESLF